MSTRTYFLFTLIAILLLFVKLGSVSVFQVAEARNAQCAAEMLSSPDKIVPTFNGAMRGDKPPLHYYAMMLAYYFSGKSEAAARFFSSLAGLFTIGFTFLFVRRQKGETSAVVCMLILLSSLHVIFQFRLATPDPYLIAAHCFALFAFWNGYASGNKKWFLLMYAMLGLATLAKGPVGLLLPAATIFFFLLLRKKLTLTNIRNMLPLQGALIFCLLGLPWYVLVHLQTDGAWTRAFFIEHNIDRFSAATEGHKGPFFLPIVFILAGLFPFSVFLPRVLFNCWKQRSYDDWTVFMILAVALILIPYSIASTKLINYTSPVYPFLAAVTGTYLAASFSPNRKQIRFLPELIILVILSCLFPIGFYLWSSGQHFSGLTGYTAFVSLFPLSALIALYFYRKQQPAHSILAIAGGGILFNLLFFTYIFPALDQLSSVRKLQPLIQSNRPVAAFGEYNDAFVFYRNEQVPVLDNEESLRLFIQTHPDALILHKAKKEDLTESLPFLQLVSEEKDMFSSRHSYIYSALKNK
jgi:4-amino-4-deoxy-L-arabinose transferase-like glycosyltransferase